mgnify:CR=1 FL=1
MKLSIIIPVYNEAGTVAQIVEKVQALDLGMEKELIIVNDGSSDGTREALAPVMMQTAAGPQKSGAGRSFTILWSFMAEFR